MELKQYFDKINKTINTNKQADIFHVLFTYNFMKYVLIFFNYFFYRVSTQYSEIDRMTIEVVWLILFFIFLFCKFLFNKSPTMEGVIVIVIAHVISHVTNTKCYKIMSGATAWKL